MRGYRWLAVATAAALGACSATNATSVLVPQTQHAATVSRGLSSTDPGETGVWGQVVHAIPSALTMTSCQTTPGSFDAVENFRGDVTATPDDPLLVSVDPADQINDVDPTTGGLKHAVFNVTPLGPAGTTRIVVRDRKGNVDVVTVTVVACVTAPPPVCSASVTRKVDGHRRTNSGTVASC
jgi:hypothetical protein